MNKKTLILCIAMLFASMAAIAQKQHYTAFNKGYRGNVGVAVTTHHLGNLSTSHGYSFGNGLYLGIGAGAGFDREYRRDDEVKLGYTGQAFAEVKYNLLDFLVSPFVGFRTGSIFAIDNANHSSAFFFQPTIGYDWNHFSFIAGYKYQMHGDAVHSLEFGIGYNF